MNLSEKEVGENAGKVWKIILKAKEITMKKLIKESNLKEENVILALGWLLRENKITNSTKTKIKLK
jgi:hypothetical protein